MSLSAEGLKAFRAFLNGMIYLCPCLFSLPLFLILYNNVYYGNLILIILVLLNLTVFIIPRVLVAPGRVVSVSKFASLCIISVISAVLIIEILFPFIWPREYASVLDLSKTFMNLPTRNVPGDAVLFKNAEQKLIPTKFGEKEANQAFKVWHAPGRQFAYFGWDPNSKSRYVNRFRWNQYGYFDNDYDLQKSPDTYRIVLIGDSYVEAVQVPLMASFHKRLETYLNEVASRGLDTKFEVIALGNSGTGQMAHHEVVRKAVKKYSPDMILVTLCSNDFCDDDPELNTEFLLSSRALVTPRFRRLVSHGYFAMAFALKRSEEIRANRVNISPELLQWAREDIPRIETAWARTLGKIVESRDLCQDHGIPFALIYLGSEVEVNHAIDPEKTVARLKAMGGPHEYISWDLEKSVRRVDAFCKENDILMISLLEPLISAQKNTGHLVFGDHYTMFGHQVVARALSSALEVRLQPRFAHLPELRQSVSQASWNPVATAASFEETPTVPFKKSSKR